MIFIYIRPTTCHHYYTKSHFLYYKMKYIEMRKVTDMSYCRQIVLFAVLNKGMQNSILVVAKWWMVANRIWSGQKENSFLQIFWWTRLFGSACASCRFWVDRWSVWRHNMFRYIEYRPYMLAKYPRNLNKFFDQKYPKI